MAFIAFILDFVLHVDRHLSEFVQAYGGWVYALLFLIIFAWTPPHFWALAIARRKEYANAGIPIDFVSFHHYAGATRDGGANGTDYEGFFSSGDGWLSQVKAIQAARDASDYPDVLLDADEVGVILR